MDPPKDTYAKLLRLLEGKDFFVITTNVDHQFQRAGFPKGRLFYMQGDYGLWQCSEPCHQATYDNYETVKAMVEQQRDLRVPSELVPYCPVCGKPMSMNLRADNTFVEDEGWYAAAARYTDFMRAHLLGRVLYLELGVGGNTPVFHSMRTKGKSTRNAIKRQISEGSHTWICCKIKMLNKCQREFAPIVQVR